jgi:signal transduction histidine kinase
VIGQVLPYVKRAERPRAIADYRRAASSGTVQEGEIRGTRKDGSRFTAAVTTVPLADSDGLPVGVFRIVRRVDADSRLEQMQSDFLSLVSQELRNPLTAILGYAQLLGRPEIRDDAAKRGRTVRALESRAQELSAVIDDLLVASRIDRGELVLRREPTDLASLVTEAVSRFEQFQPRHRFVIDADTRMPAADVDPRRIGQAVTNLLSNAVKHSPGSEEIRIKVVRDHERAAISVTDHGQGIRVDDRERVFDKVHGATGEPGAGLGLFLVRMIVEAHGGNVTVVSKPAKGSTFTLKLPLVVS